MTHFAKTRPDVQTQPFDLLSRLGDLMVKLQRGHLFPQDKTENAFGNKTWSGKKNTSSLTFYKGTVSIYMFASENGNVKCALLSRVFKHIYDDKGKLE